MKNVVKNSLLVLVAIIFTACCACRKGSPIIGNLEKSEWKLIELNDKATPESGIKIRFDANEKMIYGTAPCNNFFGGYSLYEDKVQNIKIGNVGATRKFCPDSQVEDAFTQAISSVTLVKIEGDALLMLNAEGKIVAILEAIKQ